MEQARNCPECGAPVRLDAPQGCCPACLIKAGAGWGPESAECRVQSEECGERRAEGRRQNGEDFPLLFGGYELLEEIGRGGMGVVYRARQVALNRLVALKMLLHGRFSDPAFLDRFHLEAEAAARLEHPNIVPIHEVGVHDAQPYYSMKLIEGRNLDQLIAERRVQSAGAGKKGAECGTTNEAWLRRSAELLATIARAAHYAHQHGVLHRDIKPHNILLDAAGQPYLTDFGLAKLLNEDTGLTVSAAVIGSPGFMAPEQAAGKTREVTTAADIYGLGAVLYAMLTGKAVFQADTPLETLRQVVEQQPVRPRVLNSAVDRDLETICLKCLQKEPAKRYVSAQSLAQDLENWLRAEPIQARRASEIERLWLWCRRQPVRASLTGALLLVFVLGLAGVLWQWRRAEVGEAFAHQNAYAADMKEAQRAIEDDNVAGALRLLNNYRPDAGGKSEIRNPKSEMDLRGWEWRYLWRLCQPDERGRLLTNAGSIGQVLISKDARVLVAQSGGDKIEVWDLTAKRRMKELSSFASRSILGLSGSGDLMAVRRGEPPALEVWNLNTGKLCATLDPPSSLLRSVAFSPDDRLLATFDDCSGTNAAVKVVDWAASRLITNLTLPPARFWAAGVVTFSADGTRFAIGGDFGTIRLLNWRTGDLQTITNLDEPGAVTALAFSPTGDQIASASGYDSGTILRLWDTRTGTRLGQITNRISLARQLAFSPDGQKLASASADFTLRIWNVADLTELHRFRGHKGEGSTLAFLPDGQTLVTGCGRSAACFWDPAAPSQRPAHTKLVISVGFGSPAHTERTNFTRGGLNPGIVRRFGFAFAPDSRSFITSHADGTLGIWDAKTMQPKETFPELGSNYWGVALSADGRWLAAGHDSGKVTVWDWPARRRIESLDIPFEWFGTLFFSPSGRFLLATVQFTGASGTGPIKIWRTNDWQEVPLHSDQLLGKRSVSLSPDDRLLAIGYGSGAVKLWSFPDGRLETTFTNRPGAVWAVAFSPDGRLLASTSYDTTVRLWNVPTRSELATLPGHSGPAVGAAFSPDGRRLATGGVSEKDAVKVWDVATHRELLTLQGQGQYFSLLRFSSDGSLLKTTALTGETHIWRAPSWAEIEAAERAERRSH